MKTQKIQVQGIEITLFIENDYDYISLTDMIESKDGDFFISDWLRNRNTVEFLGAWEQLNNPNFNYGEFAAIRNKVGLNSYKRRGFVSGGEGGSGEGCCGEIIIKNSL